MLWVRGREVDVPAVVEGVQFGGPEVAGVFFVGWGTPWGRLVGHVAGFVGIHLGIYVYVYIYFEREREREMCRYPTHQTHSFRALFSNSNSESAAQISMRSPTVNVM